MYTFYNFILYVYQIFFECWEGLNVIVVELKVKPIARSIGVHKIAGVVLSKADGFKLVLTCREDVVGGRVFELSVFKDRFDEAKVGCFTIVEGIAVPLVLEGQREFFEEASKKIPVDKYYVNPWNMARVLVEGIRIVLHECDTRGLADVFRGEHQASTRGWLNYFRAHPEITLSNMGELSNTIKFTVRTV